jgi:hypothetical protein
MVSRKLKTWTAYRIKGVRSELHHGLIYAWTKEHAKEQAHAIFGAKTNQERRRVYVRKAPTG